MDAADTTALARRLEAQGRGLDEVAAALRAQALETPSWGYGDTGTRFGTFPWPGAARDVHEKIADAATVHRLTGAAPSVALHVPWDRVDDWGALRAYADEHGVRLGAINPNLFQDDAYRLGSLAHPDPAVRERAVAATLACVEVMRATGSSLLSLWLADGTNYAGQDDVRRRRARLLEGLAEVHAALPDGARLLVEYKPFEPAFHHTDLPDWGAAHALCLRLGPRAEVLVDFGHHLPGTNVAQVVALLLAEGRLGGFHVNDRRYADDDLIVGSVDPFGLFLVWHELDKALRDDDPAVREHAGRVAVMIDQSHAIEGKLGAMVQSVVNCQVAYAKALLVDLDALGMQQRAGDVLAAHRTLLDAYECDVRPLLARIREEDGRHPDPMQALRESGYEERVARERGTGGGGGSGYPT